MPSVKSSVSTVVKTTLGVLIQTLYEFIVNVRYVVDICFFGDVCTNAQSQVARSRRSQERETHCPLGNFSYYFLISG